MPLLGHILIKIMKIFHISGNYATFCQNMPICHLKFSLATGLSNMPHLPKVAYKYATWQHWRKALFFARLLARWAAAAAAAAAISCLLQMPISCFRGAPSADTKGRFNARAMDLSCLFIKATWFIHVTKYEYLVFVTTVCGSAE